MKSCVALSLTFRVEPLPASAPPLPFTPDFPFLSAGAVALPLNPLWCVQPGRRSLRRWRRLVLGCSGLCAALALAAIPADGPHPLALMAGLLPLQSVGLLWAVARAS
jgi:hypothetical protein